MLSAASAIGGSFDLETVRHASGRSEEEVVSGLDELIAQGIVRESSSAELTYGFSHQKLRALVYEQTSLARRRLLHARAATALSRRLPVEENAAVVASHLRLAGDITGAAERYRIAAEHASSLHAHADALEYLEAALALGAGNGVLHERIGDTRTLLGDYGGALASYEVAASQAEGSGSARIEHKVGNVHLRRGDVEPSRDALRGRPRLGAGRGAGAKSARAGRSCARAEPLRTLGGVGNFRAGCARPRRVGR